MTEEARKHNRPISTCLHPLVYLAAVGLGLWFVVAVWVVFSGYPDMELPLWVVSGLFLIAVAVPSAIWLTCRRHGDAQGGKAPTLRDWAAGELETAQGRRKAATAAPPPPPPPPPTAAVEMLLPIAAAAFGMTVLGIVFYAAEAGAIH
jgi:hypothetical protein